MSLYEGCNREQQRNRTVRSYFLARLQKEKRRLESLAKLMHTTHNIMMLRASHRARDLIDVREWDWIRDLFDSKDYISAGTRGRAGPDTIILYTICGGEDIESTSLVLGGGGYATLPESIKIENPLLFSDTFFSGHHITTEQRH